MFRWIILNFPIFRLQKALLTLSGISLGRRPNRNNSRQQPLLVCLRVLIRHSKRRCRYLRPLSRCPSRGSWMILMSSNIELLNICFQLHLHSTLFNYLKLTSLSFLRSKVLLITVVILIRAVPSSHLTNHQYTAIRPSSGKISSK